MIKSFFVCFCRNNPWRKNLRFSNPVLSNPAEPLPGGLEQGLVLNYRFDQKYTTRVFDTSGHNNRGTVHGARWSNSGRSGGAFWFDGVDDYIEAPDTESLRTSGPLTLSVCIFLEQGESASEGFTGHILSKSNISGADYQLDIAASHTIGAGLRHRQDHGQRIRIDAQPARCTVGVNRWVHIVFVYDGGTVHTYVDGERDKTITAPGGTGSTSSPLNLGRCGNGSWQYGFTGRMDDVLIWNRALSEAEILGLWVALKRSAREPGSLGGDSK